MQIACNVSTLDFHLRCSAFRVAVSPILVFVEIFFGNVVLGDFVGVNFPLIGVVGFFHACNHAGFEHVSFFNQLFDALRIHIFAPGYSLQIS